MTTKTRKPRPELKDELLRVRVTGAEKEAWMQRAKKDGRDLSGWVRFVANREAAAS